MDSIKRDVKIGWIIRLVHVQGASLFFVFIYFHIGRKIYYGSFKLFKTWKVGVVIMIVSMAIAFLGYVLP